MIANVLKLSCEKPTEIIVDDIFKEKVYAFLYEKQIRYTIINIGFFGKDWLPLQREVKKVSKDMPVIIFDTNIDCSHYSMKIMALQREFGESKIIVFFNVPSSIRDMREFNHSSLDIPKIELFEHFETNG
jgi:hypothetical protein